LTLCLAIPGVSRAADVKLGFINSITGPEAPIGENITNGVTLAIEDLEKKGIHVELLKDREGLYAALWKEQSGDKDRIV